MESAQLIYQYQFAAPVNSTLLVQEPIFPLEANSGQPFDSSTSRLDLALQAINNYSNQDEASLTIKNARHRFKRAPTIIKTDEDDDPTDRQLLVRRRHKNYINQETPFNRQHQQELGGPLGEYENESHPYQPPPVRKGYVAYHQQHKNKKPVYVTINQQTVNGLLSLLLLFILSVCGCMGSIFIMSALTVIESLQTRGNCYLVSLALAHLLVSLLVIPSSAIQIMAGDSINGTKLCHYQWLVLEFSMIVSQLSFLLIAADNYLGYKSSEKLITENPAGQQIEYCHKPGDQSEKLSNKPTLEALPFPSNNRKLGQQEEHQNAVQASYQMTGNKTSTTKTTLGIGQQQQDRLLMRKQSSSLNGRGKPANVGPIRRLVGLINYLAVWAITSLIPCSTKAQQRRQWKLASKEQRIKLKLARVTGQNLESARLSRPGCCSYRSSCGRLKVLLWTLFIWLLALAYTIHQQELSFGPKFCHISPTNKIAAGNGNGSAIVGTGGNSTRSNASISTFVPTHSPAIGSVASISADLLPNSTTNSIGGTGRQSSLRRAITNNNRQMVSRDLFERRSPRHAYKWVKNSAPALKADGFSYGGGSMVAPDAALYGRANEADGLLTNQLTGNINTGPDYKHQIAPGFIPIEQPTIGEERRHLQIINSNSIAKAINRTAGSSSYLTNSNGNTGRVALSSNRNFRIARQSKLAPALCNPAEWSTTKGFRSMAEVWNHSSCGNQAALLSDEKLALKNERSDIDGSGQLGSGPLASAAIMQRFSRNSDKPISELKLEPAKRLAVVDSKRFLGDGEGKNENTLLEQFHYIGIDADNRPGKTLSSKVKSPTSLSASSPSAETAAISDLAALQANKQRDSAVNNVGMLNGRVIGSVGRWMIPGKLQQQQQQQRQHIRRDEAGSLVGAGGIKSADELELVSERRRALKVDKNNNNNGIPIITGGIQIAASNFARHVQPDSCHRNKLCKARLMGRALDEPAADSLKVRNGGNNHNDDAGADNKLARSSGKGEFSSETLGERGKITTAQNNAPVPTDPSRTNYSRSKEVKSQMGLDLNEIERRLRERLFAKLQTENHLQQLSSLPASSRFDKMGDHDYVDSDGGYKLALNGNNRAPELDRPTYLAPFSADQQHDKLLLTIGGGRSKPSGERNVGQDELGPKLKLAGTLLRPLATTTTTTRRAEVEEAVKGAAHFGSGFAGSASGRDSNDNLMNKNNNNNNNNDEAARRGMQIEDVDSERPSTGGGEFEEIGEPDKRRQKLNNNRKRRRAVLDGSDRAQMANNVSHKIAAQRRHSQPPAMLLAITTTTTTASTHVDQLMGNSNSTSSSSSAGNSTQSPNNNGQPMQKGPKYYWLMLVGTIVVPSLASAILFARAYWRMKEFKMRPYKPISVATLDPTATFPSPLMGLNRLAVGGELLAKKPHNTVQLASSIGQATSMENNFAGTKTSQPNGFARLDSSATASGQLQSGNSQVDKATVRLADQHAIKSPSNNNHAHNHNNAPAKHKLDKMRTRAGNNGGGHLENVDDHNDRSIPQASASSYLRQADPQETVLMRPINDGPQDLSQAAPMQQQQTFAGQQTRRQQVNQAMSDPTGYDHFTHQPYGSYTIAQSEQQQQLETLENGPSYQSQRMSSMLTDQLNVASNNFNRHVSTLANRSSLFPIATGNNHVDSTRNCSLDVSYSAPPSATFRQVHYLNGEMFGGFERQQQQQRQAPLRELVFDGSNQVAGGERHESPFCTTNNHYQHEFRRSHNHAQSFHYGCSKRQFVQQRQQQHQSSINRLGLDSGAGAHLPQTADGTALAQLQHNELEQSVSPNGFPVRQLMAPTESPQQIWPAASSESGPGSSQRLLERHRSLPRSSRLYQSEPTELQLYDSSLSGQEHQHQQHAQDGRYGALTNSNIEQSSEKGRYKHSHAHSRHRRSNMHKNQRSMEEGRGELVEEAPKVKPTEVGRLPTAGTNVAAVSKALASVIQSVDGRHDEASHLMAHLASRSASLGSQGVRSTPGQVLVDRAKSAFESSSQSGKLIILAKCNGAESGKDLNDDKHSSRQLVVQSKCDEPQSRLETSGEPVGGKTDKIATTNAETNNAGNTGATFTTTSTSTSNGTTTKAILCTYSYMTDDQLLKSNIIVFILNLTLWLPFVLLTIAAQYREQFTQELKDGVWWMATLNCCSCSYVYAITNKDFREAFNKLFYYCCCKSHVTFQKKTPIFRRQLDVDSKGNLRVHIIPGLNVFSSKLSVGGDPHATSPNHNTANNNNHHHHHHNNHHHHHHHSAMRGINGGAMDGIGGSSSNYAAGHSRHSHHQHAAGSTTGGHIDHGSGTGLMAVRHHMPVGFPGGFGCPLFASGTHHHQSSEASQKSHRSVDEL